MDIGFEELKILADRDTELRLTVEIDGSNLVTVTSDTGASFSTKTWSPDLGHATRELAEAVRYHSQPVWINGAEISRLPWQNLADIEITEYRRVNGKAYSVSHRWPRGGEDHNPRGRNAIIGGTLTRVTVNPPSEAVEFHAPADGGRDNYWTPANRIRLRPIIVVETSELDQMNDLKELQNLPPAVAERRASQIRNTLAHPDMPELHQGPLYRYVVRDELSDYMESGMPIIVRGRPVNLDQYNPEQSNADFVSTAEALYRANQPLVPVRKFEEREDAGPVTAITGWEFTVTEDPGSSNSRVAKCPRITALFTLDLPEEPKTATVPAAFYMSQDQNGDAVWFTEEITDPMELAEEMLKAFTSEEDSECQEEQDFQLRQYQAAVEAAMGQRVEASRNWLQVESERIDRQFPFEWESGTATATSHSGRITITIHREG